MTKMKADSKNRQQMVAASEVGLLELARRLQKRQWKILREFLQSRLSVSGGRVDKVSSNYRLALELSALDRREFVQDRQRVAQYVADRSEKQGQAAISYFRQFVNRTKAVEAAERRVQARLLAQLGINAEGVIKGGVLYGLVEDVSPLQAIKQRLVQMVTAQVPVKDVLDSFKTVVVGPGLGKPGMLESHYRTAAFDTFAEVDRSVSQDMADELKLNHAIYQGGIIKTTRPFCRQRNNRIYTRDEIATWASLEFQGKMDPYDPFIHLGGYNCRHFFNWITPEMAELLAKEEGYTINEYAQ